jgi:hypothetical protein
LKLETTVIAAKALGAGCEAHANAEAGGVGRIESRAPGVRGSEVQLDEGICARQTQEVARDPRAPWDEKVERLRLSNWEIN